MPGAPSSAETTRPESSASAGSLLASAAALAFNAALASKLAPVSSGSGRPREAAERASIAKGANSADISSTLPWLWLATTSWSPMKRRAIGSIEAERRALMAGEVGDARPRQPQHLGEERLVERSAFGGRLALDDPARPGQHEIRVGLGSRILGVIEIEHSRSRYDAAGDRGNAVAQRQLGHQSGGEQAPAGLMERHIAAGHRGGAGAAIRLKHIAIDADLAFAEPGEIGDCAQATPDQALNFLRAPALPAAGCLTVGAGRRRARQHAVLRRHPTLAGVAQKGRHALLDRGGAQHLRIAELCQARALGIFRDPRIECDRAHRVWGSSRGSHDVLRRGPL